VIIQRQTQTGQAPLSKIKPGPTLSSCRPGPGLLAASLPSWPARAPLHSAPLTLFVDS
jgi:hypothetical protein